MPQSKKFEGKFVFTITDQSKIDPYSDFELWQTLTMTSERLKRPPLGAAHAVGQIYEVPPPPGWYIMTFAFFYEACPLFY